jgi:hypothetical protein
MKLFSFLKFDRFLMSKTKSTKTVYKFKEPYGKLCFIKTSFFETLSHFEVTAFP